MAITYEILMLLVNCKNEHPGANRNANPFATLANNNQGGGGGGGFNNRANATDTPYGIKHEAIQIDLTSERPPWILSAYGPGRDAPEQLFGGYPMEQSFEEIRLFYTQAEEAGNAQGALTQINGLYATAQQTIENALRNLNDGVRFVASADNNHPNRIDVCKNNTAPDTGEFEVGRRPVGSGSAFSSPSTGGAFAQPSAFAQKPNPFSNAAPTTGAFGQPSTLNQNPSPFSAMGQTAGAGFGQTGTLGQRPNPFGAPAVQTGTFGQPAQMGAKPNPFGAPAVQTGAFGQPAQMGAKPNPFAATATAAPAASPFSAFANKNGPTASPFSQNNQQAQTGAFAQPTAPAASNPFQIQQTSAPEVSMDTTTTPASNPFGRASPAAANPFSQVNQAPGPFSQAPPAASHPFAQQTTQAAPPAANPFAQPAAANTGVPAAGQTPAGPASADSASPYAPNASRQHPPLSSYATKGMGGDLQAFQGKPITTKKIGDADVPGIRNFDGSWTKVWFPTGPPPYYKDTEPDREYTAQEKEGWQKFVQTGKFEGGMPEAPPLREYCTWDF